MKIYNSNTDKIEVLPKTIEVNGVNKYTHKMTESELNTQGRYKIFIGEKPNERYYTYDESKALIDNIYTVSHIPADKDVADVKAMMASDINIVVEAKQQPLDVFYMRNLKGRKPVPQDVQNQADDIYATQDIKEAEIEAFTTIEECILYEATPYDYTLTAQDELDGLGTEGTIIERHRNRVTEW